MFAINRIRHQTTTSIFPFPRYDPKRSRNLHYFEHYLPKSSDRKPILLKSDCATTTVFALANNYPEPQPREGWSTIPEETEVSTSSKIIPVGDTAMGERAAAILSCACALHTHTRQKAETVRKVGIKRQYEAIDDC